MKQHTKSLILLAVESHNSLVNEFGENSYHSDRLISALRENGVTAVSLDDEGRIKVILPEVIK